jgi:hypothetical protein
MAKPVRRVTRSCGIAIVIVSGCRLRQPSRAIAPNVLDLGDEFTGMREAFLNLAQ